MANELPDGWAVFAAAPDLCTVLTPDLKILAASDSFLRAAARQRHDVVGCHLFDVLGVDPARPGDDAARALAASFKRVLQTRTAHSLLLRSYPSNVEPAQEPVAQDPRWSVVNVPVLSSQDGGDSPVEWIVHRVAELPPRTVPTSETERKLDEAHRLLKRCEREANGLYERLYRLDTANSQRFVALSHDLRGPLTVILPPLESLLQQPKLDHRLRRTLEAMQRNAQAILHHVEGLLDFANERPVELRPRYADVELATAVRETAARFEFLARRSGVAWELDVPEYLHAQTDPDMVVRVLANLLSNAVNFVPPRGVVRCQLRGVRADAPDGCAVLSVADSGPGIALELREAVFQRFFQAGPTPRGAGLGLAVARELVDLLRGSITVGDSPEGGALVSVTLPLNAPDGAQLATPTSDWTGLTPRPPETALGVPEPAGERALADANPELPVVLVVDDDADTRLYLRTLLQRDCRVVLAQDGREALETAERVLPDLVLTDAAMPRMGGEELVHALRAVPSLAVVPVVFLTAQADDDLRMRMLGGGVDDFVLKPFNPQELRVRIGRLVDRSRAHLQDRQRRTQETIERMAGQVAHEVNNKMQVIYGVGALMLATMDEADPHREEIGTVLEAAERAANLTRELLLLGGGHALRLARFDLDELMDELIPKVRHELGPRYEVVVRRCGRGCIVQVDPGQLERVALSLVQNSRDAMPSGGRLTLETDLRELASPQPLRDSPDVIPAGRYAMLALHDEGVGMTNDILRRAFEPFFTTKPFGERRGLGLSTAYAIVRQSGGYISAHSEPGVGSTFKVFLPLRGPWEQPQAPAPFSRREATGQRVLLVEDDDLVRSLAERILALSGHEPRAVATARDALELLAREADFDLLITDVILPGMGGGELALEVSRLRPALPVLFMSGYTLEDLVARGLLTRDVAFVGKPFTPDTLARAVTNALHLGAGTGLPGGNS